MATAARRPAQAPYLLRRARPPPAPPLSGSVSNRVV